MIIYDYTSVNCVNVVILNIFIETYAKHIPWITKVNQDQIGEDVH